MVYLLSTIAGHSAMPDSHLSCRGSSLIITVLGVLRYRRRRRPTVITCVLTRLTCCNAAAPDLATGPRRPRAPPHSQRPTGACKGATSPFPAPNAAPCPASSTPRPCSGSRRRCRTGQDPGLDPRRRAGAELSTGLLLCQAARVRP